MFPPELVELIVYHAWDCLSTSSHRHAHSMANWMLVSRDWLKIVLSIVFRDLWITSHAHIQYIVDVCCKSSNSSFICELAGITDVRRHLAQTCRSLTVSVYHSYGYWRFRSPSYAIPCESITPIIRNFTPWIRSLHFVLVDCTATFCNWDMPPGIVPGLLPRECAPCLVELHVTFAYTSPPPTLLLDAPRGTFFPPPSRYDLPMHFRFRRVRRLVVREANADFVAFLTTACPMLESVESTAEFCVEDVLQNVPADVKARLVFVRLPRTATWGLTGTDTVPIPDPVLPPTELSISARKKRTSIWRVVKRAFLERK
ncbi:hypothetical protein B0H17DRAFT_72318 [Mycena rosella]|uniref:Uncharacterized protein n=1 Tax=Mycena rosella TaxID=1033263 RepID=A0AAD7GDC6_MYCRO|nr:hypothetical protein B0H17DRAFT_72318 [Mycena rosella]